MTAVTSITKTSVGAGSPSMEQKVWFYRYTKGASGDTLDCSGEFKVVRGVIARSNAGAADDPATVSSNTTVTFSTSTGASYAFVVGDG